jgi:RNA polymerase sigma factor for flagellar operon FliA
MTQAELAYRSAAEEHQDRNELITAELPHVRYIAARIHERLPKHVPLEDLVNAGVIGLIDAYRKFDVTKNVQFKSFAKFRIRGAILDSLRELDWGSRPLRRKGREIEDAINRLEIKLGRQPSETEISEELGMTIEEFHKLNTKLDGLDMVSQQVSASFDSSETFDLIESAPSPDEDPFQQCLRNQMSDKLAEAIGTLPEREQTLLSLYYHEELTMKEVGAVLGIAESRVCQLHSLALSKLRATLGGGQKSVQLSVRKRAAK